MKWLYPQKSSIGPNTLRTKNAQHLAILQASRHLRAVFFGTNIFSIKLDDWACYPHFIKRIHSIGDVHVSRLRKIDIDAWVELGRGSTAKYALLRLEIRTTTAPLAYTFDFSHISRKTCEYPRTLIFRAEDGV